VLGVAELAAHPQKALFQTAALEVVVKFPPHIVRQRPALPRHVLNEHLRIWTRFSMSAPMPPRIPNMICTNMGGFTFRSATRDKAGP
jgi:hypothetical protein